MSRIADAEAKMHLVACLAAIRGGQVTEDVLAEDVREWIAQYGDPTPENVDRWAASDWGLGFALKVMVNKDAAP